PLNGDSASIGCLSVLSVARACAGGFWETASCDRLASVDVAYWRLAARGKATGGEGTESSFPARDTEQRKLAHISVVSDTRGEFSVLVAGRTKFHHHGLLGPGGWPRLAAASERRHLDLSREALRTRSREPSRDW